MIKRILQVFGEPLSRGGQESFVMSIYRNIDRTKFQFDFFTPFYCDNQDMKKEISTLGGNVYTSNGKFDKENRKREFVKKLSEFLKENKYEIVHIHSGSIFSLAYGAKIAKESGAEKIIVHSHSSGRNNIQYKIKNNIIKKITKSIFTSNVTYYCACSECAAKWKFPKNIIDNRQYYVINNGIDLEKFKFNLTIRNEYRDKFDINNKFVLCNVGRLEKDKNQKFLIEVFSKVKRLCKDTELWIIGEGSERENLKRLIDKLALNDSVKMFGIRTDVNKMLQAVDMFVFPSYYEGLGIVAIEAQTSGLKTICSENIPHEAMVTNLFYKMKLKDGIEKWAEFIVNNMNYKRENKIDEIRKKGYDAKISTGQLERLYSS